MSVRATPQRRIPSAVMIGQDVLMRRESCCSLEDMREVENGQAGNISNTKRLSGVDVDGDAPVTARRHCDR